MGDRQDIDALLIGAVYGELDEADQARLESHLASHPGDRAAMEALTETRTRVRADLARMPQTDPAPAISTLLLQEAARRAPRRKEAGGGVLAWLQGLFTPIARHPALAGALALVLVGGSAAVLYKTGKVTGEERPVATDHAPAAAPPAQPDEGVARLEKKADPASTESYQVNLDEHERQAEKDQPAQQVAIDGEVADKNVAQHHAGASATANNKVPAKKGTGSIEVTTPDRKPKSLDDQNGFFSGAASTGGGGGAGGGQGVGSGSSAPGYAESGDDLAQNNIPAAPRTAPQPTGGTYDRTQDAKLTEWAQVQHQRLVSLVKAGNCTEAGRIGSEIAARAPEYYAAHIENDRSVRSCKQYIDQEKRKKANEQYKSRARNSYEPDLEAPSAQ